MTSLQASTSYNFHISTSIPSFSWRLRPQHYIIRVKAEPSDKSVEIMRKFSEQYARSQEHISVWIKVLLRLFLRKECHCMLFLTPENDFAGKDQTISVDEIRETTANM